MNSRLVKRESLGELTRRAMFALLERHFDGVTLGQFEHDLSGKTGAILLEDRNDQLVGFSTLSLYRFYSEEKPITVLYSGDTIVDPSAWHIAGLSRAWIRAVHSLHDDKTEDRLYWLLLTSGYRTYRYLPLFFRDFYPRHDLPTPIHVKKLIDSLAVERFGAQYDNSSGIVRFKQPQILRDGLRGIPPRRLADPHVAYFDQTNPGHPGGDELVCLAEIAQHNLTLAALRVVGSAGVRP